MYNSRFLSRAEFDQLSTSTSKPPTVPAAPILQRPQIVQWKVLEIGAIFHVIERITIPTASGSKHYAILETEQREIIHVSITPIINQELSKYDLSLGNVYIKPLGMKTLNTTSYQYSNFDIVLDYNFLFN